jgi:hypothetical protein
MSYRLPLTEARRDYLSKFLTTALQDALNDRGTLEQEWLEDDELYNNRVIPSNSPWPGASSFSVPLGETYTNATSSRLTDAIHAYEPTFTTRSRLARWNDASKALQDLVEWIASEVVKLRRVSEKFNFGLCKYGTSFMFPVWQMLMSKRMRYDIESDDIIQTVDMESFGPTILTPAIHDVLVPKQSCSLQLAPWYAIRSRLTEDDLEVRRFSKVYDETSVEKVLASMETQPDEITMKKDATQGYTQGNYTPFAEIWETWGRFKLPGMKSAAEFIVPFHLKTGTPMSLLLNFYPRQYRPALVANYQPLEYGLYGRGVMRMVRSGNIEVNKLHKHRVDNAFVANTRGYKVRKTTYITLPKEFRMWPGRMVPVDSMDDFEPFQMAEVYNSTLNEELATKQFVEQLVGLSDFSLSSGGGEGLKRVGATAALTAVQESGRVLNARLNHVRTVYAELASWLCEMYGYFGQYETIANVVGPQGAIALAEWFQAPYEATRGKIGIELTASSAAMNRELEKQSDVLLANIWAQYAERFLQVVALADPKVVPQLALQVAQAMNFLMTDILRDFNKRNPSLVLTEALDALAGSLAGPQGQPGVPGAGRALPGTQAGLLGAAATRAGLGNEATALGAGVGAGRY